MGDNRLGMTGAAIIYVLNRLVDTVDNFAGNDRTKIFGFIVLLRCGDSVGNDAARPLAAADFHRMSRQHFCDCRERSRGGCGMYHQRFAGVAHAVALRFCIFDYRHSHINISIGVHVDVAISRAGFNYRDGCVVYNRADKPRTAAWNKHIEVVVELHQRGRCLACGVFD